MSLSNSNIINDEEDIIQILELVTIRINRLKQEYELFTKLREKLLSNKLDDFVQNSMTVFDLSRENFKSSMVQRDIRSSILLNQDDQDDEDSVEEISTWTDATRIIENVNSIYTRLIRENSTKIENIVKIYQEKMKQFNEERPFIIEDETTSIE